MLPVLPILPLLPIIITTTTTTTTTEAPCEDESGTNNCELLDQLAAGGNLALVQALCDNGLADTLCQRTCHDLVGGYCPWDYLTMQCWRSLEYVCALVPQVLRRPCDAGVAAYCPSGPKPKHGQKASSIIGYTSIETFVTRQRQSESTAQYEWSLIKLPRILSGSDVFAYSVDKEEATSRE